MYSLEPSKVCPLPITEAASLVLSRPLPVASAPRLDASTYPPAVVLPTSPGARRPGSRRRSGRRSLPEESEVAVPLPQYIAEPLRVVVAFHGRNQHPDLRLLGAGVVALDLVGEQGAGGVGEAQVRAVAVGLGEIEVGGREPHQQREVGRVRGVVGPRCGGIHVHLGVVGPVGQGGVRIGEDGGSRFLGLVAELDEIGADLGMADPDSVYAAVEKIGRLRATSHGGVEIPSAPVSRIVLAGGVGVGGHRSPVDEQKGARGRDPSTA